MNKKENIKYANLPIINTGKIYKKENTEKKSYRIITGILVMFIIIILLFCGYSMAKTIEEIILKSDTQIAEPILIIENNPTIDLTATNYTGIYTFRIKNYNEENKLTEVDLKYYIEILSDVDDSISIELYQNENKINLNENRTEYIEISKDQKEEREYKIQIKYDKNKSTNLADIMQKIQIKVHSEQVKA